MQKKLLVSILSLAATAFCAIQVFAAEAPGPHPAKPIISDAWINIGSVYAFPIGADTHVASARLVQGNLNMSKPELIIFRSNEGIRVVSSRCPHCGGTVRVAADGSFACTNDQSRFEASGRPVRGPAKQSLAWYEIKFTENNEVLVNKATPVYHNKPYPIPAPPRPAAVGSPQNKQ